MIGSDDMDAPESGFLIVRAFEVLYRRFTQKADYPIYAIPRVGIAPEMITKKYRGMDREALEGWSAEELELGWPGIPNPPAEERDACLALSDLQARGLAHDDFIAGLDDARWIYSQLGNPAEREIIWVARQEASASPPLEGRLLGFEPTWFSGDHFSAICDCMCFPRWHGTDVEGILFAPFFERLNANALFDTADDAEEFLQFYQSFDWTETGPYAITTVVSVSPSSE